MRNYIMTVATLCAVMLIQLTANARTFSLDLGESFSHRQEPERRSIDGRGNNLDHPGWGAVGSQLLRYTTVSYEDGISAPAGADRPSTRTISNQACAQTDSVPNETGVTDFFWLWGQFIDHDIDLTEPAHPPEPFDIPVPTGDPYFDPEGTGEQVIPLLRSSYDPESGTDLSNPRQQINQITAFIDASQVYGSDQQRAEALRTKDGTGRLKTSVGKLLPFNTEGLPNAGGSDDPTLFLAGDVRANEQVALTALHTLFVREHNRLAERIRRDAPWLNGDQVYERARAIVGAEMQVITFNEFLPLLLGPDALYAYEGYNSVVNPGISNIFATVAFRLGHSLLSSTLLRLDKSGRPVPAGHLALQEAFFAPQELQDMGIAPLLRGLASQICQEADILVVDDIRNFLFSFGEEGFDLPALNMQRARDHGLPSYNQARRDYDLSPVTSFEDFPANATVRQLLKDIYGDVNKIDAWLGGLAEDHVPGALVGELFFAIIKDQFERLRDGDWFWYQNVLSRKQLHELERTTLADIIRRNTRIKYEIQDHVFLYRPAPAWQDRKRDRRTRYFRDW